MTEIAEITHLQDCQQMDQPHVISSLESAAAAIYGTERLSEGHIVAACFATDNTETGRESGDGIGPSAFRCLGLAHLFNGTASPDLSAGCDDPQICAFPCVLVVLPEHTCSQVEEINREMIYCDGADSAAHLTKM